MQCCNLSARHQPRSVPPGTPAVTVIRDGNVFSRQLYVTSNGEAFLSDNRVLFRSGREGFVNSDKPDMDHIHGSETPVPKIEGKMKAVEVT